MSINATAAALHEWPLAADPVMAYAEWRMSCTAVWDAYGQWSTAPKADEELAHAAYRAALDREDAAARAYSRVVARQMRQCTRKRVRASKERV